MSATGPTPGRLRRALDTLWRRPEEVKARTYHVAALALAVLSGSLTLGVMLRYTHPSGGDPGQWLSMANLYLGTGRADFSPYQYPPMLFLLLSSLIAITGDAITAQFSALFILCAGLVLACYFGYGRATGDRKGALVFAALATISQPIFEMLSWGGYPNLISFSFFVPACAYLVVAARPDARRRDFAVLGLLVGLTLLSHPLSSFLLVLCGATFLVLGLRGGLGLRWLGRAAPVAGPIVAVLYLPYLYLFLTMPSAGPTYITGEETYALGTALNPIVPPVVRPFFPWGLPVTIVILVGFSAAALFALRGLTPSRDLPAWLAWLLPGDATRARANVFLFVGAIVPPLLLPVVMRSLEMYTDFARLVYFVTFPLAAGVAAVASRLLTEEGAKAFLQRMARVAGVGRLVAAAMRSPRLPPANAVLSVVTVLCVASVCTASVRYFERSTLYYIHFDDAEDLDLANWVHDNTLPDDLVLFSPEKENGWAVKWLGGLTGRETLGYAAPTSSFYQSERILSYNVYQFFNYRYAVSNGLMEVGTKGSLGDGNIDASIAVVNVYNAFQALHFAANTTWVRLSDGQNVSLGNFSQRSVAADFADSASPRILLDARENGTGVHVAAEFSLSPGRARLNITADSTGRAVAGMNISVAVPASLCNYNVGAGFAYLEVRTGGVCTPSRFVVGGSAVPVFFNKTLTFQVDFQGSGSANIYLENFGGPSGLGTDLQPFDGLQFLQDMAINYIVILKQGDGYLQFIQDAYHFPIAYQNGKYVVYHVTA